MAVDPAVRARQGPQTKPFINARRPREPTLNHPGTMPSTSQVEPASLTQGDLAFQVLPLMIMVLAWLLRAYKVVMGCYIILQLNTLAGRYWRYLGTLRSWTAAKTLASEVKEAKPEITFRIDCGQEADNDFIPSSAFIKRYQIGHCVDETWMPEDVLETVKKYPSMFGPSASRDVILQIEFGLSVRPRDAYTMEHYLRTRQDFYEDPKQETEDPVHVIAEERKLPVACPTMLVYVPASRDTTTSVQSGWERPWWLSRPVYFILSLLMLALPWRLYLNWCSFRVRWVISKAFSHHTAPGDAQQIDPPPTLLALNLLGWQRTGPNLEPNTGCIMVWGRRKQKWDKDANKYVMGPIEDDTRVGCY